MMDLMDFHAALGLCWNLWGPGQNTRHCFGCMAWLFSSSCCVQFHGLQSCWGFFWQPHQGEGWDPSADGLPSPCRAAASARPKCPRATAEPAETRGQASLSTCSQARRERENSQGLFVFTCVFTEVDLVFNWLINMLILKASQQLVLLGTEETLSSSSE